MGSFVAGLLWRVRIDLLFQERERGGQVPAGVGPCARSFSVIQHSAHEDASTASINLSLLTKELS